MTRTVSDELVASQQLVIAMMRIAAEDGSARVGAWTLRDIAGHLATTERECFEPRIRSIAAGERPKFDYYTNDERDFSGTQLEAALEEWIATRSRLLDYVGSLTDSERARVGFHDRYGEISVDRYLEIALDHDRDHLRGLEHVAGELAR
ncbi:MAG: DinB family protein [Chloroflexi bacterium]|nr:MAG: DinB family protein [Chloroflexota bacterium]